MRKNFLLYALPIMLVFGACSRDDDATSARINGTGPKLYRIYGGGGELQTEYNYNDKGLPIRHTSFGFGRETWEDLFTYDSKDRLIKRETKADVSSSSFAAQWTYSRAEYIYDSDNRVAEEVNYRKDGAVYVLASKVKMTYGAGGRLMSVTRYSPTDQPFQLVTFQYDSKGNITEQKQYQYNGATPVLHFKYTYDQFDNKNNPYAGLGVPPFSVNKNNILQTTVENYIMTPGSTITTVNKSIYKSYNSDGYPVEVMEFGSSFTYEYK